MAQDSKIILFECNEIPYKVIDSFVEKHPRSHVARVFGLSKQFETICEDQVELDPWISWPTLHRGVIDEQHRIFHLGQALEQANAKYPPVWKLLTDAGVSVGIMGSLHTSTPPSPSEISRYAFYVPDFFSDSDFAHPPRLKPFQGFNLAMTRRSARNVDTSVAWKEMLRFTTNYVFNGLSFSTIKGTVSELAGEMRQPHLKCRRRSVQPMITLDVFLDEMNRSKPQFATLHSNHVAAAMHRFWAAAYPNDVPDNSMPKDWMEKYSGEVEYAMSVFDMMIGRLSKFVEANAGYRLLVTSSLGQAAVQTSSTKGFHTITDLPRFMSKLGLSQDQWKQRFAMVPCLSVIVDEAQADAFEARLRTVAVDGHSIVNDIQEIAPLSYSRTDSSFQLFFYFDHYEGAMQASLQGQPCTFADLGIGFYEHQDNVACSARHTPNGILAVYDPARPSVDRKRSRISTLDIAPALLQHFGVQPREYMNAADPALLDTSKPGTSVRLLVEGGGVEKPVKRLQPGVTAPAVNVEPMRTAA